MTFSHMPKAKELSQAAKEPAHALVLGIPTLQTGVFGGIIMGALTAWCYNKFYNITLPPFLAFFAGKRFVPIVTSVVAIATGVLLSFAWPPIQDGLNSLSNFLLNKNLTLTTFIFGIIERSLIPFGLHHIFYSPFWFEFGSYTNHAGELVRGDQRIWMAQLKDGVPFTAGAFTTGKYPFMMFGLPAAAFAIYKNARPERKKVVWFNVMASRINCIFNWYHSAIRIFILICSTSTLWNSRIISWYIILSNAFIRR